MTQKMKHRIIDCTCMGVILIVLFAAIAAALARCNRVAKKELVLDYRMSWDGIY